MSANRWAGKLAARVAGNAIVGGLLVGIVGAFCLGTAGVLSFSALDYLVYGTMTGGWIQLSFGLSALGSCSGFVFGLLTFGIAAFRMPPGCFWMPLRALLARVALGQLLGTLGALSFFTVLVVAKAQLQNQPLAKVVSADIVLIAFGAPALMICGAIAGALSKRGTAR